ncbi:MAG: PD40 domain-containing protein [Caldilineaceae bacterium]|nr:PD40 domain-containing protein [Caldilineaceae bacterium]
MLHLLSWLPIAAPPTAPTLDPTLARSNRLLVQGVDGNLFTISPDGTQRLDLTTDASRTRTYGQATWSTSGARIGWTQLEQTINGLQSALVTSDADGRARTRTETLFAPFYLYWSPDDRRLAYLSNWLGEQGQTIALRMVDLEQGSNEAVTLGTGQPLYFSWSPTGEQMITHVANQRIAVLSVASGDVQILADASANFATPQWAGAGDQLLFVKNDQTIPHLVLTDPEGKNATAVTNLSRNDAISFGLNGTGSHLAYIETSNQIGFNAFGPLFVYNLHSRAFTQLSDAPVIAFFWSPDGQALLFLRAEAEPGRAWLRINVWDGKTVQTYGRFIPSTIYLRDYLRFADQYMQSLRFWAPDSRAFVYAGQGEDGTRGIWIQSLDGDGTPQLVTEGLFATWSPQ